MWVTLCKPGHIWQSSNLSSSITLPEPGSVITSSGTTAVSGPSPSTAGWQASPAAVVGSLTRALGSPLGTVASTAHGTPQVPLPVQHGLGESLPQGTASRLITAAAELRNTEAAAQGVLITWGRLKPLCFTCGARTNPSHSRPYRQREAW